MDSAKAFVMGWLSRNNERKVFDWDLAAKLIKESGALKASAGLQGDWEYTGGDIMRDGEPLSQDSTYTYLASTWATPELRLGDGDPLPCFRMESETPGWGAHTFWPESALAILNEGSEITETTSGHALTFMPKEDLLDELEAEVDMMPHGDLVAKRGDNGNRQS